MVVRHRVARWTAALALAPAGCLIELNPAFVGNADEVAEGAAVESSSTETDASDTSMVDTTDDASDSSEGEAPCPDDCFFAGLYYTCNEGTCEAELDFAILEDTHADEQTPNQPHGFDTRLHVSNGQGMAQLAFLELPLLDTLPPDLESVTVTLLLFSESGQAMLDLHRITAPWSANELTWMSMPATQPVFVTPQLQSGMNELDLMPYLNAVEGQPNYGIALRTMSSMDIQIRSSEDLGDLGPRLHYALTW